MLLAAGGMLGFGAEQVLESIGNWVADGAGWFLGQVGDLVVSSTRIDLEAAWFKGHFHDMARLAALLVLPMLIVSIMRAVVHQDPSVLLRSAFVHLPLAILLTAVAVELVQLSLAAVDAMSGYVSKSAGGDVHHVVSSVIAALEGPALAIGQPGAPPFVVFLGGLLVAFASILLWLELVLRTAAIYVAVLFLPLALATIVWPSVSHWCRRLTETLAALVLSKLVIVAVLSLAASALARSSSGSGILTGAALLLLAAFAPFALLRLIPIVEAGAVLHLEGLSRRASTAALSSAPPMPAPPTTSQMGEDAGLTVSVGDVAGEPGLGTVVAGAGGSAPAAAAAGGVAAGGVAAGGVALMGRMATIRSRTEEMTEPSGTTPSGAGPALEAVPAVEPGEGEPGEPDEL